MDEVNEVMTAWHRERLDLATSPMGVWSWIHRLAAPLNGERKCCPAEYGPEVRGFDVLAALRRTERPYRLSPGQLLQQTHVTSGTMTNRVDRFRARGLVTRHSDPSDGRAVLVELTAAGRRAVDGTLGALVEPEESLLAGWLEMERRALAGMLRRPLTVVRDWSDSRHCLFRIACHNYRCPLSEENIGASTIDSRQPLR